MAENVLFESWTMAEALPYPLDQIVDAGGGKKMSTREEDCSCYNTMRQGKNAKLHPPTLRALLTLAQTLCGKGSNAVGVQTNDRQNVNYYCMEYEKETGRCALVYNPKNGTFLGCRDHGGLQRLQPVKRGVNTGEEYLAALAYASLERLDLYDHEFAGYFAVLMRQMKTGWNDRDAALKAAFVCCDNLYHRIGSKALAASTAIPLNQEQLKKDNAIKTLPSYLVRSGLYTPNYQVRGKFQILEITVPKKERTIAELRPIYQTGWVDGKSSKEKIPQLPENCLVSQDAQKILESIVKTPARFFMMTGGAGIGKTTDARIIAQVLGVPYYCFTCGPETDEMALLASVVPNMGKKPEPRQDFPVFEDMEIDPASALARMTGSYEAGIESGIAFQKILDAAYRKGYEAAKAEKDFVMVESEIIRACREPSVIEIQEPSSIEKPGTLTRLNSLFDDGAATSLLTGEVVKRNPQTVVIMTTNLTYIGCQMFNESVLSRMNQIQHRGELSTEQMVIRAVRKTNFQETEVLEKMAAAVQKIHEHLLREEIQGGVCGYREFENWIWGYIASGDIIESAADAVLSKAALLEEDRAELMNAYVLPYFEAA